MSLRFLSVSRWRSAWSFQQPFVYLPVLPRGFLLSSPFWVLKLKPRALCNKACVLVPSHIPKYCLLPGGITAAHLKPFALDSHCLLTSHWAVMTVSLAKQVHCWLSLIVGSPGAMSFLAVVLASVTPQLRCLLANEVGSVLLLFNSVSLSLEDLPRRQKLLTLPQMKHWG